MPTILTLTNATIGYPGHPVLREVNLEIGAGQTVAVLGPNGSGKTALLKTVAGVLPLLEGDLRIRGDGSGGPARVGYVPQRASVVGLLPLSVREVVEMGTYGRLGPWQRLGPRERGRVDWAVEEVGLQGLTRKQYANLSGGQQQRVLIARALAAEPSLLVMDEPLASLDRKAVAAMLALFGQLRADTGLTMLWADHFVPALEEVARELMLIEDERLVRGAL